MVVNFLVALGVVHVGLPFSANIAPLAMLFGAILFLCYGGGIFSVDTVRSARLEALERSHLRCALSRRR